MTRYEDVMHAAQLGVDALGFIFYPKSTRYVTIDKVKDLIRDVPPFIDIVAVLVNEEPDFVRYLISELPISLLQFHGDETEHFCQQFNKPFIKALSPKNSDDINSFLTNFASARALLLDSGTQGSLGGTGDTFDWSIIPTQSKKPFILAGGLNEFNVIEALRVCSPYAVDVCSGIEALPGIKDPIKMSRFIKVLWGR
jgi:phosphoribosylanthranilate isomerase